MRTADLYIRVSTDEQADKGYSQREQEDYLRKYCDTNFIAIRKVIFEDHSAKTFNRPEWQKLLADLRKTKGKYSNLVLFTKWDRFSRNAGDAYQMIGLLRSLGVDPQAVEQPLNMEIPESKIMLAFYLATPEVENDRRALNVKQGMRRARKEGRCMGRAPFGFANKAREDGTKYITAHTVNGPIMQWVFKTIAEGVFAPDQVRKMLVQKGVKVARSNFYRLIRNPIYCGKIVVKAFKEEDEQWADGLHEPLISEGLFQQVQDVLSGRNVALRLQGVNLEECLPLKGIISCFNCERRLTASASKGRSGFYYYYHAQHIYGCGCRYKADILNEAMADELKKFVPKDGMEEIYEQVALDVYKRIKTEIQGGRREIAAEISAQHAKITKARELLLDDKLEGTDFKKVKKECEDNIKRLELLYSEATVKSTNASSIDKMVLMSIKALSQVRKLYLSCGVLKKREILGSIFRETIRFDGKIYRTTKLNEGAELIYLISNELESTKKGTNLNFKDLSLQVAARELISKKST